MSQPTHTRCQGAPQSRLGRLAWARPRWAPPLATAAICLASALARPATNWAAEEPAPVVVPGDVVDGSGEVVPCRLSIQRDDGTWYFAQSAAEGGTAIECRRQVSPRSVAMYTTLSAHPFTATLPPGRYRVSAERGKEYRPTVAEVDVVGAQSSRIRLVLRRWIDMAAEGWYSGDLHLHQPLEEVPHLILAEDLNVAFPVSHWVTEAQSDPVGGNRVPTSAVPLVPRRIDGRHLVVPLNTEYELFTVGGKAHTLGAVLALGHRTPLDRPAPPLRGIAEQVHREGGLIDLEKHSWPWSLAIAPTMPVDLFELANNHVWQTEFGFPAWTLEAAPSYMHLERSPEGLTEWGWIDFGFQTYYALLNCGLRLRPSAGTGSGVHPVPVGFSRVYVELPGELTVENWLRGLNAGRSFVTNGPLLRVKVSGQPPGGTILATDPRGEYAIQGAVESLEPIERVEVLVNGAIDTTLRVPSAARAEGGFHTSIATIVSLRQSGWVAVRVFEANASGRVRFAHSSPLFVDLPGRPLLPRREEIDYLVQRVRGEIARSADVLSPAALGEFREALAFYERLAAQVP